MAQKVCLDLFIGKLITKLSAKRLRRKERFRKLSFYPESQIEVKKLGQDKSIYHEFPVANLKLL